MWREEQADLGWGGSKDVGLGRRVFGYKKVVAQNEERECSEEAQQLGSHRLNCGKDKDIDLL